MANGGALGRGLAGCCLSSVLLMLGVVNRGVAKGSGHGLRYGSSVVSLWHTYLRLLLQRALQREAFGYLEVSSIVVLIWSWKEILCAWKDSWNA